MVHFPSENTQPGAAKTVADILTAAADLIDKPGAWTTRKFQDVYENGDRCYCVVGAVSEAAEDWFLSLATTAQAFAVLEGQIGGNWLNLPTWNDAPGRTQAEVVAALRQAARVAAQSTTEQVGMEKPSSASECTIQSINKD